MEFSGGTRLQTVQVRLESLLVLRIQSRELHGDFIAADVRSPRSLRASSNSCFGLDRSGLAQVASDECESHAHDGLRLEAQVAGAAHPTDCDVERDCLQTVWEILPRRWSQIHVEPRQGAVMAPLVGLVAHARRLYLRPVEHYRRELAGHDHWNSYFSREFRPSRRG